ncbi:hypothetical protein E4U43_004526 [Claviceps pusilla]|uniref:DUF7603 domain-containing protein n=1 Tax=Claviceps pusilla TaxID=123648 RepID=A0A9P7SWU2_9HYPO|nr:hypothetical protein E4U43_004526 [Claviceps pusilla]
MTPPISRHGSALLDFDSSVLSTSATASASSDIPRHQHQSSTHDQLEFSGRDQTGHPPQPPHQHQQPHQQSHQQSHHQSKPRHSHHQHPAALGLDHESNVATRPTSHTDIHHRRLISGHSVVNSLSSLTASGILHPVESGVALASPPPLPHPLFKSSPIKRKPVSSSASSLAASLRLRDSAGTIPPPLEPDLLPKPDQRFARSPSIDSPTFYDYSHSLRTSTTSSRPAVTTLPGTHGPISESHPIPETGLGLVESAELYDDALSEYDDLLSHTSGPSAVDEELSKSPPPGSIAAEDQSSDDLESLYAQHFDQPPTPPMFASKPPPPHLKLDTVESSSSSSLSAPQSELASARSIGSDSARLAASPQLNKALPKSPGQSSSPFASFFGWPNTSPSATEFSPIPSPLYPSKHANDAQQSLGPTRSDSSSGHSNGTRPNPVGYCESYLATPPFDTTLSPDQLDEMEDELKAISSELAASIRREMDLEDLVDKLQEQVSNPQAPNKRSSDYFSDSGYSSAKASEYDHSREEIEKVQRRSEQQNASIRLELSNKLQAERSRRKVLDQQIKELAERASQMDLAHINNLDASHRVKELEKTCEDLRRRLAEERESKSNIEDLLSGLKSELQEVCNERDNLREEVVPQLRARVEGLEVQAASFANLTYESTKIQHQLQSLKEENTSLRKSMGPGDVALARSNSVAASSFKARGPSAYHGLSRSRSTSVKNVQADSRESLAERLKDVEAQRDALHSALKNLLERQEYQNRENAKKIKVLEAERQRLLLEPRKAGFDREISNLRTEINVLRRRAEEALEQKWQLEKGLGGLKMDLDRAEEEIASLRSLLEEKDILIPPSQARLSAAGDTLSTTPVTSESLQMAYKDLQNAYIEALERIKDLELHAGDGASDEKTKLAIERLEQSLSTALSERDATRRQLNGIESQVDELSASEAQHVEREMALADQLSQSAQRVEQLASQVQQQLSTNAELRKRLAETVARGDLDRRTNSGRITDLQARLHVLEERLVAAQTSSEDRVFRHEEELAQLREAHNAQLRRINNGGVVGVTARRGALLKAGASNSAFLGRFGHAISAKSFEEEVEIRELRAHVTELEKALADAENEMQHVVAKMNEAQIEVMNLQEEREMAARETRNLQKLVEAAARTPPKGRTP